MVQVRVRVPIHPSEDASKVRRAVHHVFPGLRAEERDGVLEGETDSLHELRILIRRQKILDAARKTFLRGLDEAGKNATFHLNKQAAFTGRVSFGADLAAPLGDIEVQASDPYLEAILKEMAPMTIRGIPVSEERAEQEVAKRRAAKQKEPATAKAGDDFDDEDDEELDEDEEDRVNQDTNVEHEEEDE